MVNACDIRGGEIPNIWIVFWQLCPFAMRQSVGELMRNYTEYSRREGYSSNKRSIAIGGRQTSVNLEEPFWQGLREIAAARAVRLTDLIAAVDKDRRFAN